jgi:two-component system, NtrC family, response regulator GlrR
MRQEQLAENWSGEATSSQPVPEPSQANGQEPSFRLLRLVGQAHQNEALLQELKRKLGLGQLIGESPTFLAAVNKIPMMARCEASVLISGETGTGKEVCARAIHYLSPHSAKPFMAVNCGAIPPELIENELFGHERGAYTDAAAAKPGLIQEAEGGTLFLDEIDCLPLLAQVKLLRFLQEKEYRPLGATKTKKAAVRVIAATNADLEEAVQQGRLRRDLYYRINILPLVLPPLRQRQEDIVLLARHFLAKFAEEFGKPGTEFSAGALQMLRAYSWPGNVRELEHTIERAVALTEESTPGEVDLTLVMPLRVEQPETFHHAKTRAVTQFEQAYIQDMLLAHTGNITKAARAAGKNRRAFWQLMRKHGIEAQNRKSSHS